jgi:predicted MPP superfamily phosphohydrolase
MENVQARKEELQGLIDSRQKQLDEGVSLAAKGVIESEITAFESEIAAMETQAEQEAAQQVRIQAQEEKVATITLPFDFNELYGDTTANESIIEVVQIFLRSANDEHNSEIAQLTDAHKEEIRASGEREVQLKRQNDELNLILDNANGAIEVVNEQLAEEKAAHDEVLKMLNETKLRLNDAESKRDAAVRDKEAAESLLAEKQAHIDTLRAEIAVGAKNAINVTNINPSDRLAALVEQSKNAKIKSAQDLALENDVPFRGKVLVDGVVAPPIALEVPTFPNQADNTSHQLDQTGPSPIPADHPEVTFPTDFPVQSGNEVDPGAPSADGPSAEAVTREEFESLRAEMNSKFNIVNDVVSVLAGRTGGIVTEEELQVAV